MRRVLAATALAAAALAPVASAAPSLPQPGGQCDGVVDTMCRVGPCPELDCGLVPPCVLWVLPLGCVL
jgi:hypothetical protein